MQLVFSTCAETCIMVASFDVVKELSFYFMFNEH